MGINGQPVCLSHEFHPCSIRNLVSENKNNKTTLTSDLHMLELLYVPHMCEYVYIHTHNKDIFLKRDFLEKSKFFRDKNCQ